MQGKSTHPLAIPFVFVLLWSTGFIGAKYGLPHAEPFTFLGIRMGLTLLILTALIPFFNMSWPRHPYIWLHHSIAGILIHGIYLGGVFYAIHMGLPSAMTAIIIGLQPLLTLVFSHFLLNEKITLNKVIGMIFGFIGIILVLNAKPIGHPDFQITQVSAAVIALFAIAYGTVYQKKYCSDSSLYTSIYIQYAANTLFMIGLALGFESRVVEWSQSFVLALAWLVLVLSIGAVFLLMWLIKQGEASRIGSLFYLVPPCVVIEAWLLFDETFGLLQIVGIAFCVVGVWLAIKQTTKPNINAS